MATTFAIHNFKRLNHIINYRLFSLNHFLFRFCVLVDYILDSQVSPIGSVESPLLDFD